MAVAMAASCVIDPNDLLMHIALEQEIGRLPLEDLLILNAVAEGIPQDELLEGFEVSKSTMSRRVNALLGRLRKQLE